ncbi:iron-sulfur cluster biosynthesis family protein [Bacillus massiliigorillae]|uniref:iron-sulfur cluster biosynthesis family protein n=1 Tax=Bacillus massiliigorillae TaxID=1243664 RepID=UPI0003A834D3|nr:iron-sulfur cluster biosynthesis family protein [Bacillus massiliigorillae]
MKIMWDENAIKRIIEMTNGKEGIFKLIYDTEDCGCDDGVSTLWYIGEPEGNEIEVETNYGRILVDQDKAIYMEEEMKISCVGDCHTFRLISPNGIINPYMRFYNWVK